jgi:hypothetical protein
MMLRGATYGARSWIFKSKLGVLQVICGSMHVFYSVRMCICVSTSAGRVFRLLLWCSLPSIHNGHKDGEVPGCVLAKQAILPTEQK